MNSPWEGIDQKRAKRLRNIGFGEEGPAPNSSYYVYGQNGKLWPRAVLSLVQYDGSFYVSFATKWRPGDWWSDPKRIPITLLSDLLDLVYDRKSKQT